MTAVSRHLGKRTYAVVRVLVRLLSFAIVMLMFAFVFLRVYGVPEPLLREVIRRINNAGVPIEIESVKLTLRGWQAANVRYYSRHADDLDPIVHACEVLFKRAILPDDVHADRLVFDVVAQGVKLTPSVEWGVEIPKASSVGQIDSAQVSISFLPDRILLSDGALFWMGVDFHIEGIFLRTKPAKPEPETVPDHQPLRPMLVSADQVGKLENWLGSLEINGDANVEISFMVDPSDYPSSTLSFSSSINDFIFRDVPFSRAAVSGQYAYPEMVLDQASLQKDNQSLDIAGYYGLDTKLADVTVSNSILSKRLLLLLPQRALELLNQIELGFEMLPEVDISFGPATPADLLESITGSFNLKNVIYQTLEIESLSGNIKRLNRRLEFTELEGVVAGQEHRSGEMGSCMRGGAAIGEVFWDASSHEYGVVAEGSFDPNLLLQPLSFNRVATNVIRRFRFKTQPPQAHVALGQNYSKRGTFFIDIQGSARDVFVHDVLFSSLNTSVSYKRGVLTLDPVVASQGVDFAKGSATLDFSNEMVTFDGLSSISPEALEDVIYPNLDLFDQWIKTSGKTTVTARGCVDWRHMKATRFEAQVAAERCVLPVGVLHDFSAKVTGNGPDISIHDATFALYGGHGSGNLSLELDPSQPGVPYAVDVVLKDVDFRECIQFLRPANIPRVSGKMSGTARVDADFSLGFWDVANGRGRVDVVDGQLADLPLFSGFTKVIRKMIPSFSVFSINSLSGDFEIKEGVVSSQNAYFDGDLLSAKGQGQYSRRSGFDALFHAQVFSENRLSKVLRVITDPFFKFFELKLEGPLSDPSWHLDAFSED